MHGSLSLPTTQTASRSVQPFVTAHGSVVGHVQTMSFLLQIIPSHRDLDPFNTCFLGSTRVHDPNGISIGSAVFAQITSVCGRSCRGITFYHKIASSHEGSRPQLIQDSWVHPSPRPKRYAPILYNGPSSPPEKFSLPVGIWKPL